MFVKYPIPHLQGRPILARSRPALYEAAAPSGRYDAVRALLFLWMRLESGLDPRVMAEGDGKGGGTEGAPHLIPSARGTGDPRGVTSRLALGSDLAQMPLFSPRERGENRPRLMTAAIRLDQ